MLTDVSASADASREPLLHTHDYEYQEGCYCHQLNCLHQHISLWIHGRPDTMLAPEASLAIC